MRPRERPSFNFGSQEAPGTPSEKLNGDFGPNIDPDRTQNGSTWRNVVGAWRGLRGVI